MRHKRNRHSSRLVSVFAFLAGTLFNTAPAHAWRYLLASQQEYGARRGFSLAFEDNSRVVPAKLETLKLIVSVADGKTWRFPGFNTQWQWDREYHVKAVIGTTNTELWLDGKLVNQSAGGFAPSTLHEVVKGGLETREDSGKTEFLIQHLSLRLSTSKGQNRDLAGAFTNPAERPLPIFAFDPQTPISTPFKLSEGETVTIEASFRILRAPDLRAHAPFVDRFGQSKHADWPGKIHSEAELKQAMDDEKRRHAAWGTPADYDQYGGYKAAGWNVKPNGFFQTVRRNGFWWLISPEGNPCFYIGVDTVMGSFEKTAVSGREFLFEGLPPQEGEFAPAWGGDKNNRAFGFTSANLIRKYGPTWEEASWNEVAARLKTWGFSGLGKWSGITNPAQLPAQPVIRRTGVPTLGRLPDPFDAATRASFRALLEKAILPHKDNPHIIGWSVMNEHDEIVLKSDIESILKRPATVPAKQALVNHALANIYGGDAKKLASVWKIADALTGTAPQVPAEDIETLRRFYANEYYGFVYRTVKELDPNHLYFGFWILPGWWENEEDWRLIARHCDVIGYDWYGLHFADERMERLMKEADKPVLCGEFSHPSWYGGKRGYGVFGTAPASDAASGELYARWVESAARNPYALGLHWFQYRDQPITGRGTTGTHLTTNEHFAFGLVDITDQPKWDLVTRMREANLNAVKTRLGETNKAAK